MAIISLLSRSIAMFGLIFVLSIPAAARTSLVALPFRHDTIIKINSQGYALVQEKRILNLKKGLNSVDFSWRNVSVNPSGIQLRPLTHKTKIIVSEISFPPFESALVWDIHSLEDVEAPVMISYLLDNLDGMITYTGVVNPDETRLNLKTYLVVRNFSGETFHQAGIMMMQQTPHPTDIAHLETKRILIGEQPGIPIAKVITWDAQKMPHDPETQQAAVGIPVSYEFSNNGESSLGRQVLLPGKARLYQEVPGKNTIFLGENLLPRTPVNDKAAIHIADTRDIVVTRKVTHSKRSNIKRNKKGQVQVYDELISVTMAIENLKNRSAVVTIIETISGHWRPESIPLPYERTDHKTLRFMVTLEPNQEKKVTLSYKKLNIFTNKFAAYNRIRE